MIALHMLEVRDCMSKLLLSDIFDAFLFIEGDITTFNTFHLDGYLKKDFFDTEEALSRFSSREYSLWKEVRTLCYTIIKGKKTPLGFKFVFCLSGENTSRLLVQEGPPRKESPSFTLYTCASVLSTNAEAPPITAMIHIQKMAPGPPAASAVAIPAIFPVPTLEAVEIIRA